MEIKVNVDDALVQETKDKCTVLVKLKTAIDKAKKSAAKFFAVEDLQLNASTQDKLNYAQNEYDAKASELADAVVTSILGYGLSDAKNEMAILNNNKTETDNENPGIDNKPESYQQVKSDTANTDTEPKTLRELAVKQSAEQVKNDTPAEPEPLDKTVPNDALNNIQTDAVNDAEIVTDLPEDLNDDEPDPKQDFTLQPQKESDLNKPASPIKAKSSRELLADISRAFITLKHQEMKKSNLTEDEALVNLFYCLESALAKVPNQDIFSYTQKLQKEANYLSGRFSGLCGSSTYDEFLASFITLLTKLDEPKADVKAFMSCITHNIKMFKWNKLITTAFINCSCGANARMIGKNLAYALVPRNAKTPEEKRAILDRTLKLFFDFATKGKQNLLRSELTETEKFKIAAEVHDIFNEWYAAPEPDDPSQNAEEVQPHAVLNLVSRIAKAAKDDISKLQGEVRVKTIGRGGENEGFISDDHGLLMQAITDRQAEIKAQKDNPHSLLRHLMDFKSDEGLRIYYQIWLRLAKNEHSISYKALLDKAKALRNDADKKILTAQLNSLITATGEQ